MRRDWRTIASAAAVLVAMVLLFAGIYHLLGERWGNVATLTLWLAFGIWAYADSHSKRAREQTNRELQEKGYGFLIDKDDEK